MQYCNLPRALKQTVCVSGLSCDPTQFNHQDTELNRSSCFAISLYFFFLCFELEKLDGNKKKIKKGDFVCANLICMHH